MHWIVSLVVSFQANCSTHKELDLRYSFGRYKLGTTNARRDSGITTDRNCVCVEDVGIPTPKNTHRPHDSFTVTLNEVLNPTRSLTRKFGRFCTLCQSFNSITLVSRKEKQAQILVRKWNKGKERIERLNAVVTCEIKLFQNYLGFLWNNFDSARGNLPEIISEVYCSSWILSNMFSVAKIILK